MKKILAVDDHPDNLQIMINYILSLDNKYSLLGAPNGEIACKIAEKELPDLIIMDWEMPVMNGIDAVKQLKKDEKTKDIPVVMATGVMMSSEDLKIALEAGAIDYIRKPIDKVEFLARINSILQLGEHIKEIKRQKQELTELNTTKDKLFSIIAHDLKNPFNTIIHTSEELLKYIEKLSTEKIRAQVSEISKTSRNTYHLLENLLQWSLSQIKHTEIHFDVLDIVHLINQNISLFENMAKGKSISVESAMNEKDSYFAFGDYNMTNTVIRNLLSNAIKFTPPGGNVSVRCFEEDKNIIISVQDTGIGIAEENIPKLFLLDTKLRKKGTAQERGSGLGLILCKEFVEKNNGKIWVESKLGEGSRFNFSIPKAETNKGEALHNAKSDEKQQKVIEEDAKELLSSDEIPYNVLARFPELIDNMENQWMEQYQKVRNSNSLDDIIDFGKTMQNAGEEYSIQMLSEYGDLIIEYAESFDVQSIEDELNKYKILISSFKKVLENME